MWPPKQAVLPDPPAIQFSRGANSAGMVRSCGHLHYVVADGDFEPAVQFTWRVSKGICGAESQLSVCTVAPAHQRAVQPHRARVRLTAGHRCIPNVALSFEPAGWQWGRM